MNEKKTVIITGANSGLGLACAELIAQHGVEYRVILGCRNAEKAEMAKEEIMKKTGNMEIIPLSLNLASLVSVRSFVEAIRERKLEPIYGLVCNAGISGNHSGRTEDDLDCIFESNHLGHFLLTLLLLPLMRQDGRILNVSSDMHCPPAGELTWLGTEAIAHPDERLAQDRSRYSYSKMCNLYFTYELSIRLKRKGAGIVANAFNPGLMTETNFAPDKSRFTKAMLDSVSDRIGSLKTSSEALTALMTEPLYGAVTGKYFDRSTESRESSPLSYDRANVEELWAQSVRLAGLSEAELNL